MNLQNLGESKPTQKKTLPSLKRCQSIQTWETCFFEGFDFRPCLPGTSLGHPWKSQFQKTFKNALKASIFEKKLAWKKNTRFWERQRKIASEAHLGVLLFCFKEHKHMPRIAFCCTQCIHRLIYPSILIHLLWVSTAVTHHNNPIHCQPNQSASRYWKKSKRPQHNGPDNQYPHDPSWGWFCPFVSAWLFLLPHAPCNSGGFLQCPCPRWKLGKTNTSRKITEK